MSSDPNFDRWHAARNVKILVYPSQELETFGSTLLNYHLVSELPDAPSKIRIREGRLEAHQPRVIVPDFNEITVEGLGEDAREYLEFLRDNMRILRYGYRLKSDNFSEQIVTGSIDEIAGRVKAGVLASGDRFSAVLTGVDEPWEIALVELWRREVERSAEHNIRELASKNLLG